MYKTFGEGKSFSYQRKRQSCLYFCKTIDYLICITSYKGEGASSRSSNDYSAGSMPHVELAANSRLGTGRKIQLRKQPKPSKIPASNQFALPLETSSNLAIIKNASMRIIFSATQLLCLTYCYQFIFYKILVKTVRWIQY